MQQKWIRILQLKISGLVTGLENIRGITSCSSYFVIFPITVPLISLDTIKHLTESTNERRSEQLLPGLSAWCAYQTGRLVFIPRSLPGTHGGETRRAKMETEGNRVCEFLENHAGELFALKARPLHFSGYSCSYVILTGLGTECKGLK